MGSLKVDAAAKLIRDKVNKAAGHTGRVNSFQPEQVSGHRLVFGDHGMINDLCYGKTYPNSYLDLYIPQDSAEGKHPAVLYAHGGGFLFLGKGTGDAIAHAVQDAALGEDDHSSGVMGFPGMIKWFLDHGIVFASMEYAMAPEYRFPVQIIQMNEAAGFLKDHAEEYGLDTDRFVLMGSSAGADMVEIYSLAVCDRDYAEKLGINETTLTPARTACSIIDESALLPGKPPYKGDNYYLLDAVWMGQSDLDNCQVKKTAYVPAQIRESYIPCFINACNDEQWFYDSGFPLHVKLDSIGVENEFFCPLKEEGIEKHGYMMNYAEDKNAGICWEKTYDFIRRHIGL